MGENSPEEGHQGSWRTAANVVPPMMAPNPSMDNNVLEYISQEPNKGHVLKNVDEYRDKPEPTPERLNELVTKLNLNGIQEWPDDLQQQVHDLLVEY